MTQSRFDDRLVLVASRHGKAEAMQRPMHRLLGVRLWSPPNLDTDQFGTFSGDIARPGPPIDMLRAKIALCRQVHPGPIVIATEGAYGPHPLFGGVAIGREWMMWDDAESALTVVELKISMTKYYYAARMSDPSQLNDALIRCGWPVLAVTLHASDSGLPSFKGLSEIHDINDALRQFKQMGANDIVIATDMRAHLHPPRQRTIRHLAAKLARRVCSPCPKCLRFGFGKQGAEKGLPCVECDAPTNQIKGRFRLCEHCDYRHYTWQANGYAAPGYCPMCNP